MTSSVWKAEPVRVVYILFGFIQAVVTVLLASSVFSESVAAIITGVAAAAYAAVSELFVRNDVTPVSKLSSSEPEPEPPPAA